MVKLTAHLAWRKSTIFKFNSRNRSKKYTEGVNSKDEKDGILKNLTHMHLQDNFISDIGDISMCAKLSTLYLQRNMLMKIRNLDHSLNLTHLYLQHNRIAKIENLNSLKNLIKLYLGHNNITVVEGLEDLHHLEVLHLDRQRLPPGEMLHFDPRTVRALGSCLKVLNVTGNRLTCLADLVGLRELEKFDASDNDLTDLADCEAAVGNWLYLTTAVFVGNPVCSQHKYRARMIAYASWSLTSLDDKTVTDNVRSFVKKLEHFLARRKTSKDGAVRGQGLPDKRAYRGYLPGRNKNASLAALLALQMTVSGSRLSVPDIKANTYCSWQAFNGGSNKAVLPAPYQMQNKSLALKRAGIANQPFTEHLPRL